jgi:tetratricopeptide (TPR) repeat protein
MSSFSSWDQVARWYDGLQEERVKPTAEITAKATELTKNAANDDAKLHTLYDYVAQQFHYVGIAFGIGRYQPHNAEVVLENQYGDCKDKHTLLASLLAAVGIRAYPALISANHEIDMDVPSPGQFDHVITAVPHGSDLIWLDTTSGLGPFQYLLAPLRDKQAMVIWREKPAEFATTPADPPFPMTQTFNMSAKLNDAGVLEGNAEFSSRGDMEYLLRASFRLVPLLQWKDLGQRISYSLGFGGDVSEVTASSPEKTEEPFKFSYKYTRKDFGDWPNHRIVTPAPMISLPAPDDELLPLVPIWLGSPIEIRFQSQTELPSGYRPMLPPSVHLKQDFAEFDATYEFKDGKLLTDRHLRTLTREVPTSEREQYKQFAKAVQDEYGAYIPLMSGSGSSLASDEKSSDQPTVEALRNLPNSMNAEAAGLEVDARQALSTHDMEGAISSLYRAVGADPKFTRAWVMLGSLLLAQKQKDAGIDAFHKAISSDPSEAAIPKALGWSLMAASQFEDAVPIWQDYMKAHPDDSDGPSNLGMCLSSLKRYSEAAAAYEAALKIGGGDRANLQEVLASAYIRAGKSDKAEAVFRSFPSVDPKGEHLNNVAYLMAKSDIDLPLALDYAKKAVVKAEQDSQKITLSDLKLEDVRDIFSLSAYWDTLGWVNERMSNMQQAEVYLRAAWKLTQDGIVASHLCHLYERSHQTAAAVRMCRVALNRLSMSRQLALEDYKTEADGAQQTLGRLTGTSDKGKNTNDATDIVIRERTFKLPRFLPGTESAEFFVLLASDGKTKAFKVEDTKFISGSDKMRTEGRQLKTLDFGVPAPDMVPSRFVRRGILGCYQYSGCAFVLLDPASVNSLK